MIVTEHAVVRAQQRFGLLNIDWRLIHDDVRDGLLARRAGKTHPNGQQQVSGNALYVWTPCRQRVYVVDTFHHRGKPRLRVLTAVNGVYPIEGWAQAA